MKLVLPKRLNALAAPARRLSSVPKLALALILVGLTAISLGIWSLFPRTPIIVSPDTIPRL